MQFEIIFKSKVKPDRKYEQKFSPKIYKTETKILANPEFAISGFEQPGPDCYLSEHSQQIPLMISQPSKIAVISTCMVLLFSHYYSTFELKHVANMNFLEFSQVEGPGW